MATIDSFLQKMRAREHHYGIIMIVTAYILSMLMLVLGSDAINDTKSTAAKVEKAGEETEKSDIRPILDLDYLEYTYKPYILNEQMLNPYSIKDYTTDANVALSDKDNDNEQDINTLWLLGTEMDGEQFDSLMLEMGELLEQVRAKSAKSENDVKKDGKSAKSKNDAQKDGKAKDKAKKNEEAVYTVKVTSYKKTISVTSDDVGMLERITQAEASGEDMVGKILIVNVILNRVASNEFPDTIKNVIFQHDGNDYQFSPVKSGRYWKVKISDETKQAVRRALEGEDYSQGALYFMSRKRARKKSAKWFDESLELLFEHGEHEFFK